MSNQKGEEDPPSIARSESSSSIAYNGHRKWKDKRGSTLNMHGWRSLSRYEELVKMREPEQRRREEELKKKEKQLERKELVHFYMFLLLLLLLTPHRKNMPSHFGVHSIGLLAQQLSEGHSPHLLNTQVAPIL